ncbi:MAG: MFS transporter, partial [Thermoplasmata archaeon]|nr:MFS transporter [Thermoplasmata archaeon]
MEGEEGYQEEKGPTTYSYSDLFHIPAFRKLWFGDIFSQTSDRVAFVAITVLAYGTTKSAVGLSIIMGAYFLPALIISIPGGVAADRYSRRTMMVAAEGTRVLIALFMAFLNAGLWLLPLVLAFSSLTYLFYPSRQASIPNLVPDGALMPANAAISANLILGFAIGPLIAHHMLTSWDAQWTLVAAAAIMAIGVALIASIKDESLCTPARSREESKWTSLSEGLSDLRKRAILWQGFLLVAVVMLAVGAGAVGIVVYGDEVLDMGEEGFTVQLSALAVGT